MAPCGSLSWRLPCPPPLGGSQCSRPPRPSGQVDPPCGGSFLERPTGRCRSASLLSRAALPRRQERCTDLRDGRRVLSTAAQIRATQPGSRGGGPWYHSPATDSRQTVGRWCSQRGAGLVVVGEHGRRPRTAGGREGAVPAAGAPRRLDGVEKVLTAPPKPQLGLLGRRQRR